MDNPYFYSMDSLASIQFKPMLLFNSNVRFYSIETEDPYGTTLSPLFGTIVVTTLRAPTMWRRVASS